MATLGAGEVDEHIALLDAELLVCKYGGQVSPGFILHVSDGGGVGDDRF